MKAPARSGAPVSAARLRPLVVGRLQVNCWLVACPRTREAAIIDPGAEVPRILDAVAKERLSVRWILNTHGHADHSGGVAAAKEATRAPYGIHPGDRFWIEGLRDPLLTFGLPVTGVPALDERLADAAEIPIGDLRLQVIATPGHTQGSACFLLWEPPPAPRAQGSPHVFSGDTLFAGSIGRTDLPGGDTGSILSSIRDRLLTLPDSAIVHPGHGPDTTIGQERASNPFLRPLARL